MAFSPEIIDTVRGASDIVQVVGERVPLKKAGSSYKGLCPFHNEKSPSFNVVPSKQIFHCFGCGEGGDVFAFIQKMDKVGFTEALKSLAGRAGIDLPEPAVDEEQRRESERRKREEDAQVRLLELAAAWFRRNLEEGSEGKQALDYAEGRGLDLAAREKFQLGYAPSDGRSLLSAAQKKGFDEAALLAAGLAIRNERGAYARFRARLVFPIHDPKGRLCGFGARLLGPGEPKYLNSPEGPLFSKGRLLYPWLQSKDALGKTRSALVCEGYMDAIACHQAGLAHAVASLGTALTDEHAKLLKRYVDRVLLVFDADAAGLRAARRAGEPLLSAGLDVRVVRLVGAKDPDELLRKQGPAALQGAIDAARPLLEFCVDAGLSAFGEKPSPNQRAAVLADMFPLLTRFSSFSESDAALKTAATALGVSQEAANSDFEAFKRGDNKRARTEEVRNNTVSSSPEEPVLTRRLSKAENALRSAEEEILSILAIHQTLADEAKLDLGDAVFSTPNFRAAIALIWKAPRGVVMLLENDGSPEFKMGEEVLRQLGQRREAVWPNPDDALRRAISRRQEILLELKNENLQLLLAQMGKGEVASDSLMREVQLIRQEILELRKLMRNS